MNYHNVTPPDFYAAWDNGMARHQLQAQSELRALAPRAALGLAVSSFNESELRGAGYGRTAVVPPAAMVTTGSAAATRTSSARSGARWICVGRLAPNKAIEFAAMALLVSRAHHDPGATLEVVGRPVVPSYTTALHRFVDELGLHDAVTFSGALSDAGLDAAMADADVLVMTSLHEGFGVPVLEAMTVGLPVVANRIGALPEVVDDGGLLVDTTDPSALAGAVARVCGASRGSRRRWLRQPGAASPNWTFPPPATVPWTWWPRCGVEPGRHAPGAPGSGLRRRRRPLAPATRSAASTRPGRTRPPVPCRPRP